MGSAGKATDAQVEGTVVKDCADRTAASDLAPEGSVDAVSRCRDNRADEVEDRLAGGLEEAGYGYGV